MFPLKAHNNGSYCGNRIVEEGEDCDCGRPEECLEVDKCCVPTIDALNIPGCTIRKGKQCRCVLLCMYEVTTSSLQSIAIIIRPVGGRGGGGSSKGSNRQTPFGGQ